MASLAEGLTLAKKAGMSQRDVLEVISLGAMSCPMFSLKGPAMVEGNFPPAFPLKHQHKDIRLAMELANEVDAKLPLADAASLMYRKAANMNLGDEDFSAILKAVELDESKLFDRPFFLEEEDQ